MTVAGFVAEVESRVGSDHVLSATDMTRMVKQALRKFSADAPPLAYKTLTYGGGNYVTLPSDVKQVLQVHWPAEGGDIGTAEEYLFGFTPLKTIEETYWMRRSYLQTLRHVGGSRTSWKQVGSKLYIDDPPLESSTVTIFYYAQVDAEDATINITDSGDIEWLINYSTALVMIAEGTRLRKAGMLGIETDASDMISEGQTAKEALEEELVDDLMPIPARRNSGG